MDSPNNVEFTMKRKDNAKTRLQRFGIVFGCVLAVIIILAVIGSIAVNFVYVAVPALFTLSIFACWYLLRFTRVEYEYVINGGDFAISAIYDNVSRKDLMETKVKEMQKVVPYQSNEPLLTAPDINKVLYYCSDLQHPDLYIGIFDDEKKGRVAVVFNTSRKLVQIMKFYNALNVTVKNDFQF